MARWPETYPVRILPRPHYKKKMSLEKLLRSYPDLMVVRLVDGVVDDYCDNGVGGERVLTQKVFKNSMANLSLNLAGGLFDTAPDGDLRFLPTQDEAASSWNGETIPEYLFRSDDCYEMFEPCFGICFYISEIHKRTFPFSKHFDSAQQRDEYAEKAYAATTTEEKEYDAHMVGTYVSNKQNVLVYPIIKVHHSPSMVNYWHMTLDTKRPIDTHYIHPEEKMDNSDRKMFKSLKQDLLQHIQVNAKPNYQISPCHYLKWQYNLLRFLKSIGAYNSFRLIWGDSPQV